MQSVLFSWYDFNETHKELSYLVGRERHELRCLALTHDLLAISLPDAVDTIHDLKVILTFTAHSHSSVICLSKNK